MHLKKVIKISPLGRVLKKGFLQAPVTCLLGVISVAMVANVSLAQNGETPVKPERKTVPLQSPFQEDEDLVALERAKEEARLKAAKEEAAAKVMQEESRKLALRAALAPIKILARGLQGERAVVLLAVDSNRRIMLAKDETMVLTTPAGAMELRLLKVTRQTLSFELEDGTILPLQ